MPYGLIVAIDFEDTAPMSLHVLSTFLAHINSTLNSFLYVVYNPAIRDSLINFYKILTGNHNEKYSSFNLENIKSFNTNTKRLFNFSSMKRSTSM